MKEYPFPMIVVMSMILTLRSTSRGGGAFWNVWVGISGGESLSRKRRTYTIPYLWHLLFAITATTITIRMVTIFVLLEQVFLGNQERYFVVTNRFLRPFTARYVRLNVVSWYGFVATRMELYGCVLGEAVIKKRINFKSKRSLEHEWLVQTQ